MQKKTRYRGGRSCYASQRKVDTKDHHQASTQAFREARNKELDLLNAAGPHSTPERHYPKSFFINQPEKKEDE